MKILVKVSTRVDGATVTAVRRVERKNYLGAPFTGLGKEGVREAVSFAVASLDARHGRQIGMRWAQVTPGGEK